MRIEVEPAPTGRAFWVFVGVVVTGMLTAISYGIGKQRGGGQHAETPDGDRIRKHAADTRQQVQSPSVT